jgi:4-hydroxythreonine-4-phosphate dehydrogenase
MPHDKPNIAIATGDPAGIGPEVALKAALDPAVRAACKPILVCDPTVLAMHAKACGIGAMLHNVTSAAKADWSDDRVNFVGIGSRDDKTITFGTASAAAGSAGIAFARMAIWMARSGEVEAVVAAPQNETSIALAGIPFDGHPSFVARETGTDENSVYMMLCFGDVKIAHATLHRSVRDAIAEITTDRVANVICVTEQTLRRLGIEAPRIAVSGLNPHAGEGGLFGREEIEIITPAIEAAAAEGIAVTGPFGADTLFQRSGIDAFVVMLHDQGHIAAKLMAPNAVAAMTIGTPILFSSVAHGSAHDIAGRGIADPTAMIEAVLRLSKIRRPARSPTA